MKQKLAVLGAFGVAGLIGCGLWAWAGVYSGNFGGVVINITLSQPNPITVVADGEIDLSQMGHATCRFQFSGCTGTVNIGNDTWHAAGCTLLSVDTCIGVGPGETFLSDFDATMLSATSGTVDTFQLTFSQLGPFGPATFPGPISR